MELLRRASIDVTLTGLTEGIITGLNKLKVTPDQTFGECTTKNPIDALILTGGNCAVEAMKKNEDVSFFQITVWFFDQFLTRKLDRDIDSRSHPH